VTASRSFRVRAHAKINLVLRVGPVQADGYHPLHTVFQSLALHDTLTVTVRPGPFVLTCSDPGVPVGEANLVTRAARRLWRALGRSGEPRGVAIDLAKQIPPQAGLGGGSSDAAAALVALARVWQSRGASPVDSASIAARIGADVPYFLVGGTALGLGRGDDLYPLDDLAEAWVVLGFPGFGVSTGPRAGGCERPRGARLPSSSGDRPDTGRAARGRRPGRGHDRERICRLRALRLPGARRAGGTGGGRGGVCGPDQPHR
jgi:4-diphosphocytidyl-2-C-methyl-D-erythritol kinase